MEEITVSLSGMTCPSCMTKIQKAVEGRPGVSEVKVLFNAGKVKAHVEDHMTSVQDLTSVITQRGYTVDKVRVKES